MKFLRKFTKGFTLIEVMLVVAIIALLSAILIPAVAQSTAPTVGDSAGTQAAVTVITCTNKVPDNVTESTLTGQEIDMGGYRYLCIQQKFALHAAGTETCTFNWVTSGDGTNYATVAQFPIAQAANGTTAVCTNIVIDMAGRRKAKILSIVCGNTTTADMTNILVTVTKRRSTLDN